MTRALAMEYIKTDLRVNAIAPGMNTGMTENYHVPEGIDYSLMQTYTGLGEWLSQNLLQMPSVGWPLTRQLVVPVQYFR